MINIENITIINKPVADVFAVAHDPSKTTQWQTDVEAVEYAGGPFGVGTQFTEVRKFMGKEMRTMMEVTAHEPGQRLGMKALNGPVKFEVNVTFEPIETGTKMVTVVQAEPGGFFKLAEGAVAKQLEKSIKEDNDRLKALLEAK